MRTLTARCSELEEELSKARKRVAVLEGDVMAAESQASILQAEKAALFAKYALALLPPRLLGCCAVGNAIFPYATCHPHAGKHSAFCCIVH